ncbi:hypothetical protein HOO65_060173 [Ceratocystis lukuohia]|uniref:Uncharacterized protein n=3 Tax=Ceratocystis TaxID=5157 RepID=A0A0F8B4S8_CERFI|nr:hypothetical protein CFO_g2245 [Ceratocystis platani]PHH52933.1 hypothetical protein CFIMG_008321RA00001 [Ceratocystis fimbriata CBS 114723]
MTTSKSSSFSRFFRSLKFSSTSTATASPPQSPLSSSPQSPPPPSKSGIFKTSSTSSSSSSSSLGSLVAFTGRLFRKPRPDPREIVFTETHLQHQQMLSGFTISFGRRGSWATCDREGISPCTSRVHLPLDPMGQQAIDRNDEAVDPLQV